MLAIRISQRRVISKLGKHPKQFYNQSNYNTHNRNAFSLSYRELSTNTLQDKIDKNVDKNTTIGIDRAHKIEDKLKKHIDKTERLDNKEKDKALSFISETKQKSIKFMKQYGKFGIANYWITWGTVFGSSYLSFRYGLVDYHVIDWIPVDKVENAILGFSKNYIGLDITINRKFEDLMAALAFSKITKPLQWIYVYFSTPPLSKLFGFVDKTK